MACEISLNTIDGMTESHPGDFLVLYSGALH